MPRKGWAFPTKVFSGKWRSTKAKTEIQPGLRQLIKNGMLLKRVMKFIFQTIILTLSKNPNDRSLTLQNQYYISGITKSFVESQKPDNWDIFKRLGRFYVSSNGSFAFHWRRIGRWFDPCFVNSVRKRKGHAAAQKIIWRLQPVILRQALQQCLQAWCYCYRAWLAGKSLANKVMWITGQGITDLRWTNYIMSALWLDASLPITTLLYPFLFQFFKPA